MIPDIMGWERAAPWLVAALVFGYLIGGLPIGVWVAHAFGLSDPRRSGSGGTGATNLLRAGGPWPALLTLALDAGKGAAPAWIAWLYLGPVASVAAGLGAFLGHCVSPYLGFRGGKGVATGFGALLFWRWEAAALGALAWIVIVAATRRSSLGAFVAAPVAAAGLAWWKEWTVFWPFLVMIALMLWLHRANVVRLLRGEEPPVRFGRRQA